MSMIILFISDVQRMNRYDSLFQIWFEEYWPKILNRLSTEGEWDGIRYLILGLIPEVTLDLAGKYGCNFIFSGLEQCTQCRRCCLDHSIATNPSERRTKICFANLQL